jgi:ectoine hydroxylase-related dioxygenase (phytanoyl-CoA dioxygenase family)
MKKKLDLNKIQEIKDKGFAVVDLRDLSPKILNFKKEIYEVFSLFSERSGSSEIIDDEGIIKFRLENQALQYKALKHLCENPYLFSVGGDEIFLTILKSIGFMKPSFDLAPQLRCDLPVKDQSIFHQHQDYSYNIGSENSVTIWVPLQDVDYSMGPLRVAPGSHKYGVYPNSQGIINDEHTFEFLDVPITFGNALIFNQKLVHESGRNISNRVRFSIQLRYTDLGCASYTDRGYPKNHKVVTEKFAGDIS